jgi:hypothetical protein
MRNFTCTNISQIHSYAPTTINLPPPPSPSPPPPPLASPSPTFYHLLFSFSTTMALLSISLMHGEGTSLVENLESKCTFSSCQPPSFVFFLPSLPFLSFIFVSVCYYFPPSSSPFYLFPSNLSSYVMFSFLYASHLSSFCLRLLRSSM